MTLYETEREWTDASYSLGVWIIPLSWLAIAYSFYILFQAFAVYAREDGQIAIYGILLFCFLTLTLIFAASLTYFIVGIHTARRVVKQADGHYTVYRYFNWTFSFVPDQVKYIVKKPTGWLRKYFSPLYGNKNEYIEIGLKNGKSVYVNIECTKGAKLDLFQVA